MHKCARTRCKRARARFIVDSCRLGSYSPAKLWVTIRLLVAAGESAWHLVVFNHCLDIVKVLFANFQLNIKFNSKWRLYGRACWWIMLSLLDLKKIMNKIFFLKLRCNPTHFSTQNLFEPLNFFNLKNVFLLQMSFFCDLFLPPIFCARIFLWTKN